MIRTIFSNLGSLASIVALFFINAQSTIWRVTVLVIGIGLFIFSVIDAVMSYKANKPIICSEESQINKYMFDWISTPGQVIIYSRDLSWVTDKIKGLMCSKSDDLKVFAEKPTALTQELVSCGVKLYYYGNTGYSPVSRFTIIHANKSNRQIAIASPEKINGKLHHQIHESRNTIMDKYLIDVAKDLAELTIHVARKTEKCE